MTGPNNPMSPLPPGIPSTVVSSIRQAARATNMDFGLLMAQAQQESGFNPDAKARDSSATGLYQFIDSTWLGMVQRFGGKYGVAGLAQQITTTASGRPSIADPAARQQILNLRTDPQLSAALGAEYAKLNKSELEQALGRKAGNADLYMAHFLGSGGAANFLKALQNNGNTVAADLLPEAAAANRAVFYDAGGQPRTLSQIYQSFADRINREAQHFANAADSAGAAAPGALADPAPGAAPSASGDSPAFIRALGFIPDRLDPSMAATLDLFAYSALKLLGSTPAGPIPAHPQRLT
jgi:hypothetical protein